MFGKRIIVAPMTGPNSLKQPGLETGAELAEADLAALLGVGRDVDDVDVLAVGQAGCWRGMLSHLMRSIS